MLTEEDCCKGLQEELRQTLGGREETTGKIQLKQRRKLPRMCLMFLGRGKKTGRMRKVSKGRGWQRKSVIVREKKKIDRSTWSCAFRKGEGWQKQRKRLTASCM